MGVAAVANIEIPPAFGRRAFADPVVESVPHAQPSFVLRFEFRMPKEPSLTESMAEHVRSAVLPFSSQIKRKVDDLFALKKGWDGATAEPIKLSALADAVDLIGRLRQGFPSMAEPFISPTYDGNVQLDWHNEKRALEFQTTESGWLVAGSMTDDNGRHYYEAECRRADFERIENFYRWFAADSELIWPLL